MVPIERLWNGLNNPVTLERRRRLYVAGDMVPTRHGKFCYKVLSGCIGLARDDRFSVNTTFIAAVRAGGYFGLESHRNVRREHTAVAMIKTVTERVYLTEEIIATLLAEESQWYRELEEMYATRMIKNRLRIAEQRLGATCIDNTMMAQYIGSSRELLSKFRPRRCAS